VPEFTHSELLTMEKDLLGVYLSGHPLEAVEARLQGLVTASCREVKEGTKQGEVVLGGIITSLRRRVTKAGRMMAFVSLEDLTGPAETMVLPETYERCGSVLVEGAIIVMKGRAETDDRWREDRDGAAAQHRVLAAEIAALSNEEAVQALVAGGGPNGRKTARRNGGNLRTTAPQSPAQEESPVAKPRRKRAAGATSEMPAAPKDQVHIKIPGRIDQGTLGLLKGLIGQCRGEAPVCLHIECDEGVRRVFLGSEYGVAFNDKFSVDVQGLLGDGAVWVGE
jgi:DNA polymerase-3 subunit alpha